MNAKLTLRLDEALIRAGKQQAKRRGKSLSGLVADYLSTLEKLGPPSDELPPVVSRLRGVARGVQEDDYRRYLEKKYL